MTSTRTSTITSAAGPAVVVPARCFGEIIVGYPSCWIVLESKAASASAAFHLEYSCCVPSGRCTCSHLVGHRFADMTTYDSGHGSYPTFLTSRLRATML